MKAIFGVGADIKVSQLNRLLRPWNVRLVAKGSRQWGDALTITAQAIEVPAAPVIGVNVGDVSRGTGSPG